MGGGGGGGREGGTPHRRILLFCKIVYILKFIYFHGSQYCLKRSSHSETKQKQCTKIQNCRQKKAQFWFRTMFVMSFTSVTVPLFKKGLCDGKGQA